MLNFPSCQPPPQDPNSVVAHHVGKRNKQPAADESMEIWYEFFLVVCWIYYNNVASVPEPFSFASYPPPPTSTAINPRDILYFHKLKDPGLRTFC